MPPADIFISGFGDSIFRHAGRYAEAFRAEHPERAVALFPWDAHRRILAHIAALPASQAVHLIGHSYGAHTAAEVAVATGRTIQLLITIDPVGRRGHGDVRAAVQRWINVTARPKSWNRQDLTAALGGKGGRLPHWLADAAYAAPAHHQQFTALMRHAPSGEPSAEAVLRARWQPASP